MASYRAVDLLTKSIPSSFYGGPVTVAGALTPAGGLLADKYYPVRIPAGTDVYRVTIKNADLDSNGGPTLAIKIGYEPIDGSTPVTDAFVAAGSTILQAVAAAGGNMFAFKPVRVDKESYLVIEVSTVAATFAAGEITAIVEGMGLGTK